MGSAEDFFLRYSSTHQRGQSGNAELAIFLVPTFQAQKSQHKAANRETITISVSLYIQQGDGASPRPALRLTSMQMSGTMAPGKRLGTFAEGSQRKSFVEGEVRCQGPSTFLLAPTFTPHQCLSKLGWPQTHFFTPCDHCIHGCVSQNLCYHTQCHHILQHRTGALTHPTWFY